MADRDTGRGEVLKRWREQFSDTTPIGELEPGQEASCVGLVSQMRLEPGACFQVRTEDGTGWLTGVWDSRAEVAEIGLGDALRLTGVVEADDERNLRIDHPGWKHVDKPYR